MTTLCLDAEKFGLNSTYLSNHLEAQLKTTPLCDEIILNGKMGKGKIYCYGLTNGMGFISYDIEIRDDLCIKINTSVLNPLYFIYVCQGSLNINFMKYGKMEHLEPFRSMIVGTSKLDSLEYHFKGMQHIRFILLRIDRKTYLSQTNDSPDKPRMLAVDFKTPNATETFSYTAPPNLFLYDLISKRYGDLSSGKISPLILEGAARLFIGYAIGQYQKTEQAHLLSAEFTEGELYRAQKLALMIKDNPGTNYTINDLRRMSGLNPNKLQQIFKHLFGCTVGYHIRNVRLARAEVLLRGNKMNVSEVVVATGFSSNSYFSKIFKDKYHCSPKNYQQKFKNGVRVKRTSISAE